MNNVQVTFSIKKIDSLTGLRFIAAYVVVLSHIFGEKSFALNEMGGISVQLFFVLSGFVMYINYAEKIKIQHISFTRFILLRIFRLYPIYFLSLTVYLILSLNTNNFNNLARYYAINAFMLQSWFGNMDIAFSPLNPPSWSVSNEMFFYITFFIFVYLFPSRKVLLGFVCYTCVWILLISLLKNNYNISFKWLWYINPLYRVCDFFAGYFVGYLFVYTRNHKNLKTRFKMNIVWIASAVEIILLATLFGSQFLIPLDLYWWSAVITQVIAALVIYVFALNHGIAAKFFTTRVLVLLGEASYSLYLIHVLVLVLIIPQFISPLFGTSSAEMLLIIAIKMTLPVIISVLLYKLYEAPLYQYLKRKFYYLLYTKSMN